MSLNLRITDSDYFNRCYLKDSAINEAFEFLSHCRTFSQFRMCESWALYFMPQRSISIQITSNLIDFKYAEFKYLLKHHIYVPVICDYGIYYCSLVFMFALRITGINSLLPNYYIAWATVFVCGYVCHKWNNSKKNSDKRRLTHDLYISPFIYPSKRLKYSNYYLKIMPIFYSIKIKYQLPFFPPRELFR